MRRTAPLIVGGGPAGAAAALVLARAGAAPLLVERSEGPRDVVCGGFLGWDALSALRRLGVDPEVLGARPIRRLRLVSKKRCVEASLPHPAAGLSRRRMDEALLHAAEAAGAQLLRGRTVRAADPETRALRLDGGEEMTCGALFLATGKHELRGLARPLPESGEEPAAGLRTTIEPTARVSRALDGTIELHLFDGGYAGLLLQENGRANLCLSVARARLAGAGGIPALIEEIAAEAPRLGESLAGAADDWIAVAGVPYGWRAGSTVPGVFRLGDQGAVIASLAGDGIAMALSSGRSAAQAWLQGGGEAAAVWQRRFAGRAALPVAVAERLRAAAERPQPRAALMAALDYAPSLAGLAARLTRIG